MSRIGNMPIDVPAGVEVKISPENEVVVKGPKGTLTKKFRKEISIAQEGAQIVVTRPNDKKENRSFFPPSFNLVERRLKIHRRNN